MPPNHANRSRAPRADANPTPGDVLIARVEAGLTQDEAAALLHTVGRVWRQWESGERRMHPAFWELFRLKIARAPPKD
jgi:DNA-binding transcriptional regulator YiaG